MQISLLDGVIDSGVMVPRATSQLLLLVVLYGDRSTGTYQLYHVQLL